MTTTTVNGQFRVPASELRLCRRTSCFGTIVGLFWARLLLPGLHGTHSIWPEACTDLGHPPPSSPGSLPTPSRRPTTVPDLPSALSSVETLADAFVKVLPTAHEQKGVAPVHPQRRWTERARGAETLPALYERLLGQPAGA